MPSKPHRESPTQESKFVDLQEQNVVLDIQELGGRGCIFGADDVDLLLLVLNRNNPVCSSAYRW